jgi:hypothetical protein
VEPRRELLEGVVACGQQQGVDGPRHFLGPGRLRVPGSLHRHGLELSRFGQLPSRRMHSSLQSTQWLCPNNPPGLP